MRMAEVVAARTDISHCAQRRVEIVPVHAFGHAVGHRALFGVDDELGGRAMHPRLVPARRMPDVIRARHHHGHQRRRALIPRLSVEGLRAAERVRSAPWHAIEPRHLADHEVHQADLRRSRHRRAGLHADRRKVMPVDRRASLVYDLRIGERAERLRIQLRHGGGGGGGRVRPAKHEGRAEHRLIAPAEGAHRPQHGLIPDERRVAVAVPRHHRVRVDEPLPEEDVAHLHHILGVLRGCGHAHERLVGMFHRGIGDAEMPVRDHMVHRLHDMMGGGMKRREHMSELVEIRQIIERRPPPHIVEIAQVRRPGHRNEDRMVPPEGQGLRRVAGVIGECLRDGGDQLPHHAPVQMHPVPVPHIRAGALPVFDGDRVAEDDADILKDRHGGGVDLFDLLRVHRLGQRQPPLQSGQHVEADRRAQLAP